MLAEQSTDACVLLYFLSLLPTGVTFQQLKSMYNDDTVQKHLDIIKKYEFLDTGRGDTNVLTPFVIHYCQSTIESNDKENFIEKICTYFCGLLKKLYSII
jgi:hypothetical protein